MTGFYKRNNFFDLFFDDAFGCFTGDVGVKRKWEVIEGDDNSSTIVFNAVGLSKEDISVTAETTSGNEFILIKGKTVNDILNTTYEINQRFRVTSKEIDSVDVNLENGLLYVTVNFKTKKESDVTVNWK